jgi:hypothetical protein
MHGPRSNRVWGWSAYQSKLSLGGLAEGPFLGDDGREGRLQQWKGQRARERER